MVRAIVGGVAALVIGGTTFAVSNTDVINNLSKNTGMSQKQAQQYVDSIPKSDLKSFSKIGQDLVSDGNSISSESSQLDCANYTYQWVTTSLTCEDGKSQLQTIASNEISLGNCYQALGSDLGNSAKSKISECISDITSVNLSYGLPIATIVIDSKTANDLRNTNEYNKSVLEAALQPN